MPAPNVPPKLHPFDDDLEIGDGAIPRIRLFPLLSAIFESSIPIDISVVPREMLVG